MNPLRPRDIPKHPYSIYRRAIERENRLVAKLNRTFIDGSKTRRDYLFRVFFDNQQLMYNLADRVRQNVLTNTWQYIDSGVH